MVLKFDINVFNNVCSLSSNQNQLHTFHKESQGQLEYALQKTWESGGVFKMIRQY